MGSFGLSAVGNSVAISGYKSLYADHRCIQVEMIFLSEMEEVCEHRNIEVWVIELHKLNYENGNLISDKTKESDWSSADIHCEDCGARLSREEALKAICKDQEIIVKTNNDDSDQPPLANLTDVLEE
jgi:hypothetical protein